MDHNLGHALAGAFLGIMAAAALVDLIRRLVE